MQTVAGAAASLSRVASRLDSLAQRVSLGMTGAENSLKQPHQEEGEARTALKEERGDDWVQPCAPLHPCPDPQQNPWHERGYSSSACRKGPNQVGPCV